MKRIAFIITGQIRENSLGYSNKPYSPIIDSHSKYIFSDEFKELYPNYDVYMVVDNVNEQKCKEYFGDNLRGLICLDTNKHIPMIQMPNIPYCNGIGYNTCVSFYRAKLAWNMLEQSGQ